jgi:spore coat protein U-like protein
LANAEETSFLRYNIYTDANYWFSGIWNNDVEEMSSVAGFLGSGVSHNLTVYGEIPKNQKNASAGSYTDTITVTLTY